MKARFTDKEGEVRELIDADVKRMRPMSEILPANLPHTIDQALKQYIKESMVTGDDKPAAEFRASDCSWERA